MVTPRRLFPILVLPLLALLACKGPGPSLPLDYPDAFRSDHTDDYFGTAVTDPYRWMEDLEAPELAEWVEAENRIAVPILDGMPDHAGIQDRLTELWNYERFGIPNKEAGLYFFTRNDGLQDQDVVFVSETLDGDARVLIDPNGFSEDATIALAGMSVSPDGRFIAYATSDGGTDWNTWHVREVETGEDLPDVVSHTKFTSASWLPNGSGFFYSRYPLGPDGEGDGQAQVKIYFHEVGTDQNEDDLVYALEDSESRNPYGTVTEDGRYLIIEISEGYNENGVYYLDLGAPNGRVVRLLDTWDALYSFIGNDGPAFYFQTNKDAPKNRVIAIDIRSPDPSEWREIIPEAEETLSSASYVGGVLVGRYLQDAKTLIRLISMEGGLIRNVDLPGIGTAGGFDGHADDPETFYSFQSYT
ncbi:MAG: S9 family peptidase, partial [Gemmatimonadetes bacterium]|nr:S9 family peptidase [Gemmatimonadota bacterium]